MLINTIPMHFTIPPTVIYSAPFPYQSAAKYRIGANLVWIKQQNGHFFADFEVLGTGGRVVPKPSGRLHASGHATFPQMIDEILIPLLGNTFSGKTVILIHGEHPVSYATQLKQRLRLNNPSSLRVISRLPNYDPANPEATYFKLPLF